MPILGGRALEGLRLAFPFLILGFIHRPTFSPFTTEQQCRIPSKAMDSFSSPSIGSGSSNMSTSDIMDQLKTQLAQAYAQEFLETVRGKCFEKCITKPSSSLSGSESSCISRCVDRYIEATGIVSRALFNAPR